MAARQEGSPSLPGPRRLNAPSQRPLPGVTSSPAQHASGQYQPQRSSDPPGCARTPGDAAARPSLGRAGLPVVATPLRFGSRARPQCCAPPKSLWMRRVLSRSQTNKGARARRRAPRHELHTTRPAWARRPNHEVASRRSHAWRSHRAGRLQAPCCWPLRPVVWPRGSRMGRRRCSRVVATNDLSATRA